MGEVIKAAVLSVALPRRVDERQVARFALRVRGIDLGGKIKFLQCQRDFLCEADADKAAGGNGVAIANQAHGFGGRDDLALLRSAQIGQRRVLVHCGPPEPVSNGVGYSRSFADWTAGTPAS